MGSNLSSQAPCQFGEWLIYVVSQSYSMNDMVEFLRGVGNFRYILGMERNTQFVGQSTAFLDSVERASRAAPMGWPVLVIGERGTGKELIAERLHQLSRRWQEPLVTLNCAAWPESLIEAELFGHEQGAFTGAT